MTTTATTREGAMAMDAVLKELESRIEELVEAYSEAKKIESKLTARVEELEARLASDSELGERVAALEKQRDELGKRLTKILSLIDGTLSKSN
jgi:predicted RNase H-like nuclease (RuvC/YqgF family)